MLRFGFNLTVALTFCNVFMTSSTLAQDPPVPEKIYIDWAEPEEVEYDIEIVDQYWAWKEVADDPVGIPILRVAVVFHDLKNDTKVKKSFGLTSRITNYSIKLSDLKPEKASLLSHYREYYQEGDSIDLSFRVEMDKPFLWVTLSCLDLGFSVDAYNKSGQHLFMGLRCQQVTSDIVSINVIKSKDSDFANIRMDDSPYSKIAKTSDDWREYQVAITRIPDGRHLLGTFRLFSDKKGNSQVGYKVFYDPNAPRFSKYSASLTLGVVNTSYEESPSLAQQTQWSLFVQADFHYHAIPGSLDVDLSVAGDFLPFSQENESFNNAKFLRVRTAVGYWLPFARTRRFSTRFALGTYLWRIDAEDAQYGTGSIFSPYAELRFDFAIGSIGPMSAYMRLAPLNFKLSNKELHFGAEYHLKPFNPQIEWSIVAEARTASFTKEDNSTLVPTTISHDLFALQFGLKVGF